MDNLVQKTFKFDHIAQLHSFDGEFPQFTIREATPDDIKDREEKLSDLRKDMSTYITRGDSLDASKMEKRLELSIPDLAEGIQTLDVMLVLMDCNLTLAKTGDRIVGFENGLVVSGILSLLRSERKQIHRRVLKINPSWQGETERVKQLLKEGIGTSDKKQERVNHQAKQKQKQKDVISKPSQEPKKIVSSQVDKTLDLIGRARMPSPIQKEFHLGTNDDDPTLVTIREATAEENASREAYLLRFSKQTKDAIKFIKDGYRNTLYASTYESRIQNEEYIDDAYERFSWLKEGITNEIVYFENTLTLAACNIQEAWNRGPAFKFTNGHIDGPLIGLSNYAMDMIHQKVLEMNPAWAGGLEALLNPLIGIPQINQKQGNFTDLALTSIFSKSKTYLNSLMQEINTDVFNNMGSIEVNVPSEVLGGNKRAFLWALKKVNPPLQNFILYYSPIPTKNKSSYIGILEHGNFEIRVVARRDKFNYWDTDIDGVINTLRTAIQWWKTSAVYNAYEIEAMNEAANDEWVRAEGEAFQKEMEDFGYGDDDY